MKLHTAFYAAIAAATAILASAPAAAFAAEEIARGVVFEDTNGDGRRDEDERGLEDVCVSNGLKIVKTDAEGRYELSVDEDTILFVIKPRNWQTAIDELNMPRFYYIHKPEGSPDENFVYKGVAPTGPLPESVDFPLTKSPEPKRFSVVVMGDPQPINTRQVHFYANDTIAELLGTTARFGISMGDLVGDDLDLFGAVNKVQATVGIPWYNVHGNHDQNYRAPDDKHADETFERVYGPATYAFEYGEVHFIILDNVHWRGFAGDDADGKPYTGNYQGRLSEAQLEFVKNYIATAPTEHRVVICTHIPLPLYRDELAQHSTLEYRQLLEILSTHPHTLSLSAHMHTTQQFFAGADEGYKPEAKTEHHHANVATGSGSWFRGPIDEQGFPVATMSDGTPNGYVVATFDGRDYSLRYKAARMPADYQMAIHAPLEVEAAAAGNTEIVANVFQGNEKSRVRLRVRSNGSGKNDAGDWTTMEQRPGRDPGYVALHRRDAALPTPGQNRLPDPVLTTHLWVGKLPADLSPGVHVVEVETTDMFGQKDRAQRLIEVR